MSDERTIELETKLSYQEDTIRELSRIVAEQEKRLARQEERMTLLLAKVKELSEFMEESPASRKPPHY